jgi:hypothetical protein
MNEAGMSQLDLLKIDIEGAEIALLLNTPADVLRRAAQVTVEFHNLCGLCTVRDVEHVVARMSAIGFDAIRFDGLAAASPHPDEFDHLNWLFVRRDAPTIGSIRRWYVRQPIRLMRQAVQRFRRRRGRRNGNRTAPAGVLANGVT